MEIVPDKQRVRSKLTTNKQRVRGKLTTNKQRVRGKLTTNKRRVRGKLTTNTQRVRGKLTTNTCAAYEFQYTTHREHVWGVHACGTRKWLTGLLSEWQPALTNFSLEVAAGQTVALVGHSGAGKSSLTTFYLLLACYSLLRLTTFYLLLATRAGGALRCRQEHYFPPS